MTTTTIGRCSAEGADPAPGTASLGRSTTRSLLDRSSLAGAGEWVDPPIGVADGPSSLVSRFAGREGPRPRPGDRVWHDDDRPQTRRHDVRTPLRRPGDGS